MLTGRPDLDRTLTGPSARHRRDGGPKIWGLSPILDARMLPILPDWLKSYPQAKLTGRPDQCLEGGPVNFEGFCLKNRQSLSLTQGDNKMIDENWVDDDRGTCKTCVDRTCQKQQYNFPADVFEKISKVNHPANRWMFDIVVVRNGWAKVEYEQDWCSATNMPCLPLELKHRCDFYKEVGTETTTGDRDGGAQWWE
jgi:hypothetical protein